MKIQKTVNVTFIVLFTASLLLQTYFWYGMLTAEQRTTAAQSAWIYGNVLVVVAFLVTAYAAYQAVLITGKKWWTWDIHANRTRRWSFYLCVITLLTIGVFILYARTLS